MIFIIILRIPDISHDLSGSILAYLKLSGYPIEALKRRGFRIMDAYAKLFPDFAVNIYLYSRALSALLGALTVFLIYLIGKKIFNEKAGLLSAAFLAVTMGFAGVNHFAKTQALRFFCRAYLVVLREKFPVLGGVFCRMLFLFNWTPFFCYFPWQWRYS